jgi:hypothetical protein
MEPAAKMRLQMDTSSSPFKQLSSVKEYPIMVLRWIQGASQEELNIGAAYGLHLLVSSGKMELVGEAIKILGITCDNVSNPEIAIILVQYLSNVNMDNLMTAIPLIARMVSFGVRKRIVDLFLEGTYRFKSWDVARYIIHTYLRGNPYLASGENLLPWAAAPVEMKNEVLSWFLHQEIWLPSDTPGTVLPSEELQTICISPELLAPVCLDIYRKVNLESLTQINLTDIKYVIDGANVLYTGGEKLLRNIIRNLSVYGRVILVIPATYISSITFHPATVFKTPPTVNDDFCFIWLAMMSHAYLVTNDLFRDHINGISPLISKWRKQVAVSFDLHGNLNWPLPFSQSIQTINEQYWVPTEDPGKWKIL